MRDVPPYPSTVMAEVRVLGLADERTGVLERARVGNSRQEDLRPVIVHDTARTGAVAGVQLRKVLPHRDELHAVTRRRRRQHVEFGQGCNVGGLIEHDEQRRVERCTLPAGSLVRGLDDLGHQGGEQRPQATLVMGGRT